ncbi:MAG: hypothetical protein HC901_00120 [Bdellovibrionaceae bacterium]|nr:hypothetical protein [Pseudobdellovibrionaceae bacterium]
MKSILTYGDKRILSENYQTMKDFVDFLDANTDPNSLLQSLGSGYKFLGDWVTPHGNEGSDSPEALLFNNCYFAYISDLLAKIAGTLGYTDDEATYAAKADAIRNATHNAFFNSTDKTYIDALQTHCVMPLVAGVVPQEYISDVQDNLENNIVVTQGGHLDTGLQGTYFMTKYLTEIGRSDLLQLMASQTTYPGYGWFLSTGHTTWPERWDGTGYGSGSKAHGCFNGIGAWFQEGIGGFKSIRSIPE